MWGNRPPRKPKFSTFRLSALNPRPLGRKEGTPAALLIRFIILRSVQAAFAPLPPSPQTKSTQAPTPCPPEPLALRCPASLPGKREVSVQTRLHPAHRGAEGCWGRGAGEGYTSGVDGGSSSLSDGREVQVERQARVCTTWALGEEASLSIVRKDGWDGRQEEVRAPEGRVREGTSDASGGGEAHPPVRRPSPATGRPLRPALPGPRLCAPGGVS